MRPEKESARVLAYLSKQGLAVVPNHPLGLPVVRNADGREKILHSIWKTSYFPWKAGGHQPQTGMPERQWNELLELQARVGIPVLVLWYHANQDEVRGGTLEQLEKIKALVGYGDVNFQWNRMAA